MRTIFIGMAIRTIFTMVDDCTRGERLGWLEFVRDYAPVGRRLLGHYFPTLRPELDEHVAGVFRQARLGTHAWLRNLRFANEREFLMAFRELVFAYARPVARLPAPELSLERAHERMRELPVVQRELFWMYVKGYDAAQTATILMNADATAAAVQKVAADRLAELLPGGLPEGSPSALLAAVEKAHTPECLALKTCNNLINGQISWQDRDRAERHIGDCLHCLDRFTSFQEMIGYRRETPPLGEDAGNAMLGELGIAARKGLVARLFSSRA